MPMTTILTKANTAAHTNTHSFRLLVRYKQCERGHAGITTASQPLLLRDLTVKYIFDRLNLA